MVFVILEGVFGTSTLIVDHYKLVRIELRTSSEVRGSYMYSMH
jgi:hypothetical protein